MPRINDSSIEYIITRKVTSTVLCVAFMSYSHGYSHQELQNYDKIIHHRNGAIEDLVEAGTINSSYAAHLSQHSRILIPRTDPILDSFMPNVDSASYVADICVLLAMAKVIIFAAKFEWNVLDAFILALNIRTANLLVQGGNRPLVGFEMKCVYFDSLSISVIVGQYWSYMTHENYLCGDFTISGHTIVMALSAIYTTPIITTFPVQILGIVALLVSKYHSVAEVIQGLVVAISCYMVNENFAKLVDLTWKSVKKFCHQRDIAGDQEPNPPDQNMVEDIDFSDDEDDHNIREDRYHQSMAPTFCCFPSADNRTRRELEQMESVRFVFIDGIASMARHRGYIRTE